MTSFRPRFAVHKSFYTVFLTLSQICKDLNEVQDDIWCSEKESDSGEYQVVRPVSEIELHSISKENLSAKLYSIKAKTRDEVI